jgi:WD40 repeat protein
VGVSRTDFVLDHTLKGHSGWVTGVAFSPDGRRLASGSWDQTVKFWNVSTGQELSTVSGKMNEVQAVAFSHDGHGLAAGNSGDTVTVWDATTGRQMHTLSSNKPLGIPGSNWVYSIAFSPDGRWLASGVDDKTVRLWDVATGRIRAECGVSTSGDGAEQRNRRDRSDESVRSPDDWLPITCF